MILSFFAKLGISDRSARAMLTPYKAKRKPKLPFHRANYNVPNK